MARQQHSSRLGQKRVGFNNRSRWDEKGMKKEGGRVRSPLFSARPPLRIQARDSRLRETCPGAKSTVRP